MHTLLLRLSGAMQSWGIQSRFGVRDSGLEPSKSGVLGLVCAALGIDREDDACLKPLAALKMGVRVDREGLLKVDYHTARDVLKAGGGIKQTELSNRYYLADALFLVGLESPELTLLEKIQHSFLHPAWPLFLGRKSFVPGEPVRLADGLKSGQELEEALRSYPMLSGRNQPERLRLVLEDAGGPVVRQDQPLSFAHGKRRFASRRLTTRFMHVAKETA